MKSDKAVLVLAIFLVAITGAAMIISFIYAARPIWFTGFVTEFATINLSVESSLAINFSTDIINWGSGRVVVGADNATLNTAGVNTGGSNPSQRNGNWTNNTAGLVLENIGNALMNISINVTKNATTLLGGTNPVYKLNFSEAEAGSCRKFAIGLTNGSFYDVNATFINATGYKICESLNFSENTNSLRIDVFLQVPRDSITGSLSDTITAIGIATT